MRRAAFACGLGLALAFPAGGPAASSKCAARRSTTLIQNTKVRVFKQPTRDGVRGFDVYACRKTTGETLILGDSSRDDYPFLPPAMDLTGPVIGYADEQCNEEVCETGVLAIDMRHPHDAAGFLNGSVGSPTSPRLVKVGSLRVTGGGTLVWIACPERHRRKLTGSRAPNCNDRGDRDSVYVNPPDKRPIKRLDRGKTIDPSSLRMTGHRVRWRHGDRWRHAIVP
jgi:hypothetical protein